MWAPRTCSPTLRLGHQPHAQSFQYLLQPCPPQRRRLVARRRHLSAVGSRVSATRKCRLQKVRRTDARSRSRCCRHLRCCHPRFRLRHLQRRCHHRRRHHRHHHQHSPPHLPRSKTFQVNRTVRWRATRSRIFSRRSARGEKSKLGSWSDPLYPLADPILIAENYRSVSCCNVCHADISNYDLREQRLRDESINPKISVSRVETIIYFIGYLPTFASSRVALRCIWSWCSPRAVSTGKRVISFTPGENLL
jgi:hypothetical protein